jgi:hypothetical protein
MEGTVFDLFSTIETAKQRLNGNASGGRYSMAGGNFFDSIPNGADAHIICGVTHDWDGVRILKNCRRAMAKNGRLLLVEMVVPENDGSYFSKLLDLNMLVMTGGREPTQSEFCALLGAAGYTLTRVVPTLAPQSIIEAIAG